LWEILVLGQKNIELAFLRDLGLGIVVKQEKQGKLSVFNGSIGEGLDG
jgi:hypothetical protein